MKQLSLFDAIVPAQVAPEPPRNPDPPPQPVVPAVRKETRAPGKQPLSGPSTLRDKLMERRKREQRQHQYE